MAGIEKEAKKVMKKAEGSSKKGSSGKTSSKQKGGSSGADKAKRAAKELLR